MAPSDRPYYQPSLARIHHDGFGFHADATAPGILQLLAAVRVRAGLVVEIGCGSGLLTKHLTDAGHRVLATDASPAMIDLARAYAPDAVEHRVLVLPDDPLPEADAIVSTGHALSYLATKEQVEASLVACARALRPGGILALDLEDVSLVDVPLRPHPIGWLADDWALVVEHVSDGPSHLAREHTIFVREADGRYRREFERHDNVLVDVSAVAGRVLGSEGLVVEVSDSFGDEANMTGLKVVTAVRAG